jgi:hypothetical protein
MPSFVRWPIGSGSRKESDRPHTGHRLLFAKQQRFLFEAAAGFVQEADNGADIRIGRKAQPSQHGGRVRQEPGAAMLANQAGQVRRNMQVALLTLRLWGSKPYARGWMASSMR